MTSQIEIGPLLVWPRFPDFPAHYYKPERMQVHMRAKRYFYDWTAFTPEALPYAEAYWQQGTELLASLLPRRLLTDPAKWRGINLGTFTGAYQKAWMRRGYAMFGVELQNVIEDLKAYGCDGQRDNVYDLSTIADEGFDFGVRVFCQKEFYEKFETRAKKTASVPQRHFRSIRRILKNDGALIGILYDWYTAIIVAELARLGGLKLWPMNMNRLAFCVDLTLPATEIPDPRREALESLFFADVQIDGAPAKHFLPTNEIVSESGGGRIVTFAPPLRVRKAGRRHSPPAGAAKSPSSHEI